MKKIGVILLQAGYWAVYGLLIVLFDIVVSLTVHRQFVERRFWWVFWHNPVWLFLVIPAVGMFYCSYFVLFRRFLARRRFMWLGVFLAAGSVAFGIMVLLVSALSNGVSFGWSIDTGALVLFLGVIGFVNGILGLVLKGFVTWVGEMRLKEELNRKNYEMELALIRSQLSPHFLFNTLNNIDILIERDAVRASAYLKKLSDMLRFMLYETKTALVPIGKELGYIEKYIELQRIRIANPAAVRFNVEGEAGGLMVESMLFLPFIENAFKHAEKRGDDAIRIVFVLSEGQIVFYCENRYRGVGATEKGGIGNGLVRKRLALLYPGRHSLELRAENDLYQVKLKLDEHHN
jgi:two-component system, LytTR family, sensor kinase